MRDRPTTQRRVASRSVAATGPRVATRRIGDAWVLEGGDLTRGAPAVWAGTTCARVRIHEVSRDFEFGVDALLRNIAASAVRGPCIVPRLATYRDDDVLAFVDDDVADVDLAQLLARLEPGPSRVGLALYVGRACVRAWQPAAMVERVGVEMDPRRIALAWDGGVHHRVSPMPAPEAWEWSAEPVAAIAWNVVFAREERTLGALLYAIIAGAHPFAAVDDDDEKVDAWVRARTFGERRFRGEHVELRDAAPVAPSVHALVESMLTPTRRLSWEQLAASLDEEIARDPFDAAALAGMLDAAFREEKRGCLVEREDRLGVTLAANARPGRWRLLDDSGGAALDDDDGAHLSGLWHEAEREPRVDPVDPFDDDP